MRFQAVKELTEAAEDVVIDYVPAPDPDISGDRQAMVWIARREVLTIHLALCRGAGLKLQSLTPRPFGVVACLTQLSSAGVLAPPPAAPEATVAALVAADRWAEFCVLRGGALLFARSLATGPTLVDEIRRNLAVYAAQTPHRPVQAIYVADSGEHAVLRERLQGVLKTPVYPFDPFFDMEKPELPATNRGAFAGAAGLLYAQTHKKTPLIDFVRPREPTPARKLNYAQLAIAGAAARDGHSHAARRLVLT